MAQLAEIRTLQEFAGLGEEWRELQLAVGSRSIFLSHEWFGVCAKNLSPHQQMLILVLRDRGRLMGIAPLLQQRARVRRFPVTQIGFLQNPVSPFADFLLLDPVEGFRTILGYLSQTRMRWDLLRLTNWREDSPLLPVFCRSLEEVGHLFRKQIASRNPFLLVRGSWEEFYKSTSQKFKKTRRSVTNRVHRLGDITVQQVSCPREAGGALEELLAVSARSWKRLHNADLLSLSFERAFLTELTRMASEAGWLRLWLLRKGDESLAAEFHLDDHGTVYGLRAHYDEAFASCSPGTYLDFVIVQELFRRGCSGYDMGPGAADYKLAWTEQSCTCYTVEAYNRGGYAGFLGRLENSWIPALKSSALGRWLRREPSP